MEGPGSSRFPRQAGSRPATPASYLPVSTQEPVHLPAPIGPPPQHWHRYLNCPPRTGPGAWEGGALLSTMSTHVTLRLHPLPWPTHPSQQLGQSCFSLDFSRTLDPQGRHPHSGRTPPSCSSPARTVHPCPASEPLPPGPPPFWVFIPLQAALPPFLLTSHSAPEAPARPLRSHTYLRFPRDVAQPLCSPHSGSHVPCLRRTSDTTGPCWKGGQSIWEWNCGPQPPRSLSSAQAWSGPLLQGHPVPELPMGS